MATSRVKIDLSLRRLPRDIRKSWSSELRRKIEPAVVGRIENGLSPVEGFGKYQKYSDSYKRSKKFRDANKSPRPVNLKLTGRMLKTFFTNITLKGLSIGFRSPTAKYHDLPRTSESLKKDAPKSGRTEIHESD